MSVSQLKLRLSLDSQQFEADCALLAQAAERSAELRESVLDLGDLSAHVRCVQVEALPAVPAGELVYRLEPSDRLAAVFAAVRAGYVDRG
jgi:hypothetical protein